MSGNATSEPPAKAPAPAAGRSGPHDVIIGAGLSGMYQLYRLRELGLSVRVFEAGNGVGGTWYWNRYPGARFDSESWTYGYSFSDELLREWEWSEHFTAQPETLRYCNFVADKLDLRREIEFKSRIRAAAYDEAANQWEIEIEDGRQARARFLITAIGPLSAPTMPSIPGVESFRGESYHTGTWPHRPVSFADKRVAVIGTGATGVQAITEIAKTVGHLTVFQRTPNWCAPLHNSAIDAATQAHLKATYPEICAICRDSFGCFIHQADPRNALEVSPAVREAFYEKLYCEPGFGIWTLLRRVLPRDGGDATPGGAAPRHHRQPRGAALLRGRHDGADGRGPGRVPVDRAAALYEPEAFTDTMSVVYYGNYLTYFAVAWVEYLRERGLPISQVDKRVHLPVVEALVRYVKPARLDDLLEVTSRVGERKRASFTFFYEINNQKREIVATGYTRHVCLDPVTAKMIAIPDWLKDRMPDEDLDPTDRFTRKG